MSEEPSIYDAGDPEPFYASAEERIAAFLAQPKYAGSLAAYTPAQVADAVAPFVPPNAPDVLILDEIGRAIADGRLTPGART